MTLKALCEAFVLTVYALLLNIAALAAALLLFIGPEGAMRYSGFSVVLLVLASFAVFFTALGALRHGPIDTPRRGLRLGLTAAGMFYALIVFLFGFLPALAYMPSGNIKSAAGYLGDVVRIALTGSYGLPIITGALGGMLYGWLRSKAVPV